MPPEVGNYDAGDDATVFRVDALTPLLRPTLLALTSRSDRAACA